MWSHCFKDGTDQMQYTKRVELLLSRLKGIYTVKMKRLQRNANMQQIILLFHYLSIFPHFLSATWALILDDEGESEEQCRTHWLHCVCDAARAWQGCYNSRRGLYNHLITKAVSQSGSGWSGERGVGGPCWRRTALCWQPPWLIDPCWWCRKNNYGSSPDVWWGAAFTLHKGNRMGWARVI